MGKNKAFTTVIILVGFIATCFEQRAMCQSLQSGSKPERRFALVIGNSAYNNRSIPKLRNPPNDADSVAKILTSLGFNVVEKKNTRLKDAQNCTEAFCDQLGNADVGLFYYSGHGTTIKGQQFIIPVDADYDATDDNFMNQLVNVDNILRNMQQNNNRLNIIILDACRNPAKSLQPLFNNELGPVFAQGSLVAFATASRCTASDGGPSEHNGIYTKGLIHYLATPNIEIEEMFKRVRTDVINFTSSEQQPWEYSSLQGDFYFHINSGFLIVSKTKGLQVYVNDQYLGAIGNTSDTLSVSDILPNASFTITGKSPGSPDIKTSYVFVPLVNSSQLPIVDLEPAPPSTPVTNSQTAPNQSQVQSSTH